jgi:hypothetical protein
MHNGFEIWTFTAISILLLSKFQSDFLPGCSTTHQLVEL